MNQGKICDTPCEACSKRGLPIYPVRYAIAPDNANAPALSGAFKTPPIALGADATYTARLLRPGYLYMYDEARKRWEGYIVTESGYYVPFPVGRPDAIASTEKPLEPCARDSRQEVAAFISISSPKQATAVWLGFSDVMWTAAVLQKHEDAVWRARHMRKIDVAACLGGGSGDHIKPIAQLESSVAEHGSATRGQVFSFSRFGYLATRTEKTQALIDGANNMYENKGVIVALDDPPGVQQELSDLASARLQFFMDGEGGRAPDRARKAMVSSAIVQLRGAIENQAELEALRLATQMANQARSDMGAALLFESVRNVTDAIEKVTPAQLDRAKADAWEKYPRKYNEPERAAWQAQYDEALEAFSKSKLEGLAKAHVAWMKSEAMVAYMACNFDTKDAASGAGYSATIYACTRGTAGMQPCFDAYVHALSANTVPDETSIVMNALIFNQEQLKEAARSATEIDARDVPWDTVYGVYAAAVIKMGEGNASQVTQLIHELSGPLAKVVSKMIDGPAKLVIGVLSLHAGAPWIKVELKGSRKDFRRLLVKRIVDLNGELNPRQIKMAVDQEMMRLAIRGEVTEGRRGAKWITLLDARQIKGLPAEGTVRAQGQWLRGRMQTPEQLYDLETKAKFGAWRNLINTNVRLGTVSGILQVASLTKLVSDLPPPSRTSVTAVKSVNLENDGHEKEQIHRGADHRFHQAGRGRPADQGAVPQGRLQRCHLLQVARQVRRHGCARCQAAA